jgi:nicotinamidase-related amidase
VIDTQFLPWLERRSCERKPQSLDELLKQSGGPEHCALVVVDLLEGFCREGPLASDPVKELIEPIRSLLVTAHRAGVSKFYFPSDCHSADSPEFDSFPPHCLEGTKQSEIVSELTALEFSESFVRVNKGSISSLIGTDLPQQLSVQGVRTIICVGDCTDLCLYHLAVGLRFWANAHGDVWRIVVPQDLVATYDMSVATALEVGALPHPADFLSDVFLYHMELNGVEVVSSLLAP